MTGIILAAGMGTRLRPLTGKFPKALLEFNDKTLIIHSLEKLARCGVHRVSVVVGYQAEKIQQTVNREKPSGMDVQYATNPDYAETGSMFSLSCLESRISGDCVIIESDLLYEERGLRETLDHPSENVMLVAEISGSHDEVFVCADHNRFLTSLGKNVAGKDRAIGELVGITKLSGNYLRQVWEAAKKDYESGKRNFHYEEVIARVARAIPLQCHITEDLKWIEIDKYSDLQRARDEVFPAIVSRYED